MGRFFSAAAFRLTLATHLLALPLLPAAALPVSAGSPVRVDFNLQPLENEQFSFPALLMDYTVSFDRAEPLNPGEGYRIDTYTSTGLLIGTDSYTNETFGGIIGCACITQHLLQPLFDNHFYAILSSLNGTFDVTEVIALAYDNDNGFGNSTRAFGVIHRVPEPTTLALVLASVSVLVVSRKAEGSDHRAPEGFGGR